MTRNYTLLSLVCLALSVPLIVYLAGRDSVQETPVVRFGTFNLALHRPEAGALLRELDGGRSEPARRLAEIVQRLRIDVLLVNELDRDDAGRTADVFAEQYLNVSQDGQAPIDFAYRYAAPVNTGEPSGRDLDGDGDAGGPGDAWGFGTFPGQYGMALFSRYPILADRVRTFRLLSWSAMPDALRPEGFWDDDTWRALRLSSKSHWDVPIGIGTQDDGLVVHALCSHPTPPAFDGPEDRNGRRNHDEIRFWVDYLTPGAGGWIVDDEGVAGGLDEGAAFVVLGDLNCDPVDGEARREALLRLLGHSRVQDPEPRSVGGAEAKLAQFGLNMQHQGDPALDTGDFADEVGRGPGNLRVDYVLPSAGLTVTQSGVFWPQAFEPAAALGATSDHRLVWVELALPPRR